MKIQLYSQSLLVLQAQTQAMSCRLSLCTWKVLLITNALSNHSDFLFLRVIYCLGLDTKWDILSPVELTMHVTFGPKTHACIYSQASTIACNKGDYFLLLKSEERMKEASRYCKIAQSGVKSVFCAYSNVDCVQQHSHKFELRTLT